MRHVNRLLAALLCLAIIIAGLLVIIEVIADRIHHRPALVHWHPFYNWAARTEWQAGAVRMTCALLVIAGLVLLIAELRPPRVSRLRLAEEVPHIDAAYTRRGVAAAVRAAAGDVDGIRSARATVKRRKVVVSATAGAADKAVAEQLRESVMAAVQQRLDSLALSSAPSLSATVKPRSN
jgi:hypothetical protein